MYNETSCLLSTATWNKSSFNNDTETTGLTIYVFTPAPYAAKHILCFLLAFLGGTGFVGCCLIFYFLWKKPKTNALQAHSFAKNLTMYVRSLCLSDLLSCAVSLPLVCLQMSLDVFQSGWVCKIVRYLNFVFPVITINNLVVISLEKYLSTRPIPRTFRVSTVRKMIIAAWLLGILVMLFPSATYDGIRVDLNDTHYTVICRYVEFFYPFKITLILFPIQFVFPTVFIIYVNVSLIRTVWIKRKRQLSCNMNNAFKAHLRATRIKGISLLIALTFAFIFPFSLFIVNTAYTQIAKPQRDFSTDYMIRYGTGSIAFLNPLLNFIIYFAQMKDFREFLRKRFYRKRNKVENQPKDLTGKRMANNIALKPTKPNSWRLQWHGTRKSKHVNCSYVFNVICTAKEPK